MLHWHWEFPVYKRDFRIKMKRKTVFEIHIKMHFWSRIKSPNDWNGIGTHAPRGFKTKMRIYIFSFACMFSISFKISLTKCFEKFCDTLRCPFKLKYKMFPWSVINKPYDWSGIGTYAPKVSTRFHLVTTTLRDESSLRFNFWTVLLSHKN